MNARLRQLWDRHPVALMLAVTAALAVGCYGFVVGLPFFFDDLPIMTFLSGRGWAEIWVGPPENPFYRPLTFTIYKLGRLLPAGADRVALHGFNLLLHWLSAALMVGLLRLTGRSNEEALLASVLFVVFPFKFMAVAWVTAMPHLLVTALALAAVVAALRAEETQSPDCAEDAGRAVGAWWALSLVATALAPLAHESGYVTGGMVGAALLFTRGLRGSRLPLAVAGVGLNLGALVWRTFIPGAGQAGFNGLQDWLGNTMFSLHGLVYPVTSLIGTLVRRFNLQDFFLVVSATVGLALVLVTLMVRRGEWRWVAFSLCWWAGGMLPAVTSLRYGYNYSAPRVYSLASPGITFLWAGLIVSLSRLIGSWATRGQGVGQGSKGRRPASRRAFVGAAVGVLLGGAIVCQNVSFLGKQRELFTLLNGVYRHVFQVATRGAESEPGFVNLPTSLAHGEKTYAMILETVLFLPPYSNFAEFLAVNGAEPADAVVYSPVVEDSGYACGLRGEGLDWGEMRQFAVDHDEVWLARWRDGRLVLDHVGQIKEAVPTSSREPAVVFDAGAAIQSAAVQRTGRDSWSISLDWVASHPVDARIFVHVRDGDGNLAAQADGPALGGMVPAWIWQPGDRITDVRYVSPQRAASPLTVQVGLFDDDGRLPAFADGIRCPDDVCTVATHVP